MVTAVAGMAGLKGMDGQRFVNNKDIVALLLALVRPITQTGYMIAQLLDFSMCTSEQPNLG